VVDPYAEFGFNYAYGKTSAISQVDGNPNPQGSFATYSLGGFANARVTDGLLVGGGLDYTYLVDESFDKTPGFRRNDDYDHWQAFGAIQYHLFKKVFIKAVGGYALANFNPNTIQGNSYVHYNDMVSGRVRVLYLF
jgi:hypothetical protein